MEPWDTPAFTFDQSDWSISFFISVVIHGTSLGLTVTCLVGMNDLESSRSLSVNEEV
jgi:hypothetical protein